MGRDAPRTLLQWKSGARWPSNAEHAEALPLPPPEMGGGLIAQDGLRAPDGDIAGSGAALDLECATGTIAPTMRMTNTAGPLPASKFA